MEEYKQQIADIMKRLIQEKHINVANTRNEDGKLCFKIQIIQPEWYTELNDDLKYNVEVNLQEHFKPIIQETIINAMNHKNDEQEKHASKKIRTE